MHAHVPLHCLKRDGQEEDQVISMSLPESSVRSEP